MNRPKYKAEFQKALKEKLSLQGSIKDLDRLYRKKVELLEQGEPIEPKLDTCIRYTRIQLGLDKNESGEKFDDMQMCFAINWDYAEGWEKVFK